MQPLRFTVAVLASITTLSAAAAAQSATCTVDGELVPARAGAPVVVESLDPEGPGYRPIDELATDARGRFTFRHPCDEPDVLRLLAGEAIATLILDRPEEIAVTLRHRDDGGSAVSGSTGNRRFEAFGGLLEAKNAEYFGELIPLAEEAVARGDEKRIAELEALRDQGLEKLFADLGRELGAMGPTASAYEATGYLDLFKQRWLLDEAFARFEAWDADAKITRALRRRLATAELVAVGAEAPIFALPDRQGRVVALADFAGRWLFVDFWASWCLNCRVEMPRLAEVYREHRGSGLEMVGITARDDREAWLATIDRFELPWTNLWDADAAVTDRYLVSGQLPASFLVDPTGRIVARNLTAEALGELLGERLGTR